MNSLARRTCALRYSQDGYVRLKFDALTHMSFRQYLACDDLELRAELIEEGIAAERAGYCEWVSIQDDVTLSLGWAWYVTRNGGQRRAPGPINCNVMLISPTGYDLGPRRTDDLISAWLFHQSYELDRQIAN